MDDRANITVETGKLTQLGAIGLDAEAVLQTAGLPTTWLSRPTSRLTVPQYRAFLLAMEQLSPTPTLPLVIGRATVSGTFHPVSFAALCSSDLGVAARRVRDHTRLCVPKVLEIDETGDGLSLAWHWEPRVAGMPFSDAATPIVFMVELARVATRTHVVPTRVVLEHPVPDPAFVDFFGVTPEVGDRARVTFRAEDATRPFLTANPDMWSAFEPHLQRRMQLMEASRSVTERVRERLLECLPSGQATADTVARRMGRSRRTLARQLAAEGTSFRALVATVRHELALHYLRRTDISYGEIAFLLGYDETSSFFRAFRAWEGSTPEATRRASV
jgi:AraC-like DNA-binding protein